MHSEGASNDSQWRELLRSVNAETEDIENDLELSFILRFNSDVNNRVIPSS